MRPLLACAGVDDLKPSVWDRARLYEFGHESFSGEPVERRRLRLRAAFFEQAASAEPLAVVKELKARAEYWGLSLTSLPDSLVTATPPEPDPSVFRMAAGSIDVLATGSAPELIVRAGDPLWKRLLMPFLWFACMYAGMLSLVTNWGAMVFAGLLIAAVGAMALSPRTRLALARYHAGSGRCPDCRYDLAGLPDAVGVNAAAGLRTGPRRCPECGAGWPLIPPPVPVGA